MDPSAIVLLCYVCLLFFAIILYDSLPKGKLCYKTLSVRAFYRWICFGCCINCYWVPAIILESKIQKKKNADNKIRVINTGICSELRSDINSLKESVQRVFTRTWEPLFARFCSCSYLWASKGYQYRYQTPSQKIQKKY